MPRDLKQLRLLLGDLLYNRTVLPDMSKRIRSITALLKKGFKCSLTTSMDAIVRDMLAVLTGQPVLIFPDSDVVEDGSRPFRCIATPAVTALALR